MIKDEDDEQMGTSRTRAFFLDSVTRISASNVQQCADVYINI